MSRRRSAGGWQLTPLTGLKGLQLRDQPEGIAPNYALDISNVELTDHGSARRRDGWEAIGDLRPDRADFVATHVSTSGARLLILAGPAAMFSVSGDGTNIGGRAATHVAYSSTQARSPAGVASYVCNELEAVSKFDGTLWTQPAASVKAFTTGVVTTGAAASMPKARVGGYWTGEERLVLAGCSLGPQGAASTKDTVWISENGLPETYLDTNTIVLGAGDGELFQGVHQWRDMLFVFKETKYWVLTGTTINQGTGAVKFNRRNVQVGIGPVGPHAVCVGRDGVYFVGRKGIYRTRGGDPELLTDHLEPLWGGPGAPYFTGGVIDRSTIADTQLCWIDEQLRMGYKSTQGAAPDRILTLDPRDGRASIWKVNASGLGTYRAADRDQLVFGLSIQSDPDPFFRWGLGRFQYGLLTDDGAPFDAHWLGAFFTPNGDRVVRHRRMGLWGSGTLDVGLCTDYNLPDEFEQVVFGGTDEIVGGSVDTWGDGLDASDTWGDGLGGDLWAGDDGGGGESPQLRGELVDLNERGSRVAVMFRSQPVDAESCQAWAVARATMHFAGNGPRSTDIIKES